MMHEIRLILYVPPHLTPLFLFFPPLRYLGLVPLSAFMLVTAVLVLKGILSWADPLAKMEDAKAAGTPLDASEKGLHQGDTAVIGKPTENNVEMATVGLTTQV